MQHKIIGTTMPVLEMTLDPGDRVVAEAGDPVEVALTEPYRPAA